MGFCRRCGDIVTGARCRCGGTAVAPVVPWNKPNSTEQVPDMWSKTYIHTERSPSPTRSNTNSMTPTISSTDSSTTKRFPRPVSSHITGNSNLGNRVSAHIASTVSQVNRPPSPLKYSTTLPAPESDILPSLSPHDTTLSKVYGSVLQPKDSLMTHSCAICSSPFPPDATIYPDPNVESSDRFLCRPCFTINGGSKGNCPACARPVLILKSEGGFIRAADKYWHKQCFNCSGCFQNVGDKPMLDLLGRPTCAECFDNCLTREPSTPKKASSSNYNSPRSERAANIGGMSQKKSEGSPVVEELEQRLGITKSREGSPALEELSHRLSMIGRESSSRARSGSVTSTPPARYSDASRGTTPAIDRSRDRRDSPASPNRRYGQFKNSDTDHTNFRSSPVGSSSGTPGPIKHQATGSPAPTQEAIEEMKQRFMKGSPYSSSIKTPTTTDRPIVRRSRSSTSLQFSSNTKIPPLTFYNKSSSPQSPTIPSTPDLADFSDTTTQSSFSGPDSPPRNEGIEDVFSVPKIFDTGYDTLYAQGNFLDESVGKEASKQVRTLTHTPTTKLDSKNILPPTSTDFSTSTRCTGCGGHLFSMQEGGKFVTVPSQYGDSQLATYHTDCFKCAVCGDIFKETGTGHAVFVRASVGPCHVECAPPTKVVIQKVPGINSIHSRPLKPPMTSSTHSANFASTTSSRYNSSSRLEQSLVANPPTRTSTLPPPRFGSRTTCPGCHVSVSPMEQGVVLGPQGTRWHASCLVCGGKNETSVDWRGRSKGRKKGEPGCGKKLDSAAKSARDGGVWCRECLLLLGVGGSPQTSPTRTPLLPTYTGSEKILPQFTGTTLARQFTGLGGGRDPAISRQLTGGGLNPTRSISPTKQLGGTKNGTVRPRPKSVIGMRNTGGADEGRGMFLVRQLTGGPGNEFNI